jgi:hypothetical protein
MQMQMLSGLRYARIVAMETSTWAAASAHSTPSTMRMSRSAPFASARNAC